MLYLFFTYRKEGLLGGTRQGPNETRTHGTMSELEGEAWWDAEVGAGEFWSRAAAAGTLELVVCD